MRAVRKKAFLCDLMSVVHSCLPMSKQIRELKLHECQLLELPKLAWRCLSVSQAWREASSPTIRSQGYQEHSEHFMRNGPCLFFWPRVSVLTVHHYIRLDQQTVRLPPPWACALLHSAYLETRVHVAQASLESWTLPLSPSKHWDYRHMLPYQNPRFLWRPAAIVPAFLLSITEVTGLP